MLRINDGRLVTSATPLDDSSYECISILSLQWLIMRPSIIQNGWPMASLETILRDKMGRIVEATTTFTSNWGNLQGQQIFTKSSPESPKVWASPMRVTLCFGNHFSSGSHSPYPGSTRETPSFLIHSGNSGRERESHVSVPLTCCLSNLLELHSGTAVN